MNGQAVVWAQQAIRRRVGAALEDGALAAIDLGASQATCIVARVQRGLLRRSLADRSADPFAAMPVIGVARRPADGMKDGEIADPDVVGRTIAALLEEAGAEAGIAPARALFSISGGAPRSLQTVAETALPLSRVDDAAVGRLLGQCRQEIASKIRRPIHLEPLEFVRDGSEIVSDPRGAPARTLAVRYGIVTVECEALEALAKAARVARIYIAGVACAAASSGMACLTEDELKLGAACVDIGAASAGVANFKRGRLRSVSSLGIGGNSLTRDLAEALEVPFAEAERMKLKGHGGLIAADRVVLGGAGPGEMSTLLIGVIRPRLEELFEMVRGALTPGETRPVILTGGGSAIPGTVELARRVLGRQVRLGRSIRTRGVPPAAAGPEFSAAHGLIAFAARLEGEPLRDAVALATAPEKRFGGIFKWIRENW